MVTINRTEALDSWRDTHEKGKRRIPRPEGGTLEYIRQMTNTVRTVSEDPITKEWPTVSRILAEGGGHWSDTIIWAKDRLVFGRSDYQRAYEPIWYGWREGAKRQFRGGRDRSDLWEISRPEASVLHPTMKPPPLIERAIDNSSSPGDRVLDPFLGSGSTLVATERTGRVCCGMGLDDHYASLAIVRWEAFIGHRARRVENREAGPGAWVRD
jgi:DNA modification methylase